MRLRLDVFKRESSSEIISTHSDMFRDALKVSTSASLLGTTLSKSILNFLMLRKKREEVCAFLRSILLPLHPTLSAILALTLAITEEISKSLEALQKEATPFQLIIMIVFNGITQLYSYL